MHKASISNFPLSKLFPSYVIANGYPPRVQTCVPCRRQNRNVKQPKMLTKTLMSALIPMNCSARWCGCDMYSKSGINQPVCGAHKISFLDSQRNITSCSRMYICIDRFTCNFLGVINAIRRSHIPTLNKFPCA